MKTKKPNISLTFVIADMGAFECVGEPISHRTVKIELTDEQKDKLTLKQTHHIRGDERYESISQVFMEVTKQNPAYEGSQNWAKEMLLNGKCVCNPIHFHDDTYWFMRDDLCVKVVGKTEEYATHIENVCALYHLDFNDGWELFQNVAETNPLDLSNIKPGTKVRLSSNEIVTTKECYIKNEILIDGFYSGDAIFFNFDGTAVNGSDIRIVEVVE